MTDLDAAIRAHLAKRPSVFPGMSETMREYHRSRMDQMADALLVVLDRHEPTHYDGQVQYAYVDEPVYNADGAPRGHARVRGEKLPPDWCGPCSEVTPCDEVRDIARALGIEVARD